MHSIKNHPKPPLLFASLIDLKSGKWDECHKDMPREAPMKKIEARSKVTRGACSGTDRPRTREMQLRSFALESPTNMMIARRKVTRGARTGTDNLWTREMQMHSFLGSRL
jgi:hypothetical protein